MTWRYYTLDVFTDRPFGGNPLAVFPWAEGLEADAMQRIARELNLSETVFVLPPDGPAAARRARIFTPAAELPFAGHPTVGTAYLLAALGEVAIDGDEGTVVLQEGVGPVAVRVRMRDGQPTWSQLTSAVPPAFGASPAGVERLAEVLCLQADDVVAGDAAPCVASCGVPFLIVRLTGLEALAAARLRVDAWESTLAATDGALVLVYTADSSGAADVRARMFAPGLGVPEDPATGSAAVALAGVLGRAAGDGRHAWLLHQGVEMGRPSRLEIEADVEAGVVVATRVGGPSVIVSEGRFRVP